MNKIIKLSSIAAISLCLSVCSRNVEQDIKTCINTLTTYHKNMKVLKEESNKTAPNYVNAFLGNHTILSENSDACFSAYTHSKKPAEEINNFLVMSYLGYLNKEDRDNSIKVCKLISDLPEGEVVSLSNTFNITQNCTAEGINQAIKQATASIDYFRNLKGK